MRSRGIRYPDPTDPVAAGVELAAGWKDRLPGSSEWPCELPHRPRSPVDPPGSTAPGASADTLSSEPGVEYCLQVVHGVVAAFQLRQRCELSSNQVAVERLTLSDDNSLNVEPVTVAARETRLWRLMTEIWPDYDRHQRRATRQIPVVILEKVTT